MTRDRFLVFPSYESAAAVSHRIAVAHGAGAPGAITQFYTNPIPARVPGGLHLLELDAATVAADCTAAEQLAALTERPPEFDNTAPTRRR